MVLYRWLNARYAGVSADLRIEGVSRGMGLKKNGTTEGTEDTEKGNAVLRYPREALVPKTTANIAKCLS